MISRPRIAAIALVAAVTTAGCSSPGTPGVRTDELQADIVFGVDIPEEVEEVSVSPVNIPVEEVSATPAALTSVRVPPTQFRNRIPDRFKGVPFTVSAEQAAATECPMAPVGSAAAEVAPDVAKEPPAEGVYRYKINGTRTFRYTNGAEMQIPVTGFQPRVVRNVKVTPNGVGGKDWTFEMVAPTGDGGVQVTGWSVNNDTTQRQAKPPYVGENSVRASEPDGGFSLISVERFDGNGSPRSSFRPTPITYLPMPVTEGQEFQSIGIDARGGTQRVDGQPLKRQSVDACGTFVDGWLVELDITDAHSGSRGSRHEEIVVATPFGALPVSQRVVDTATAPDGTIVASDITFSIGQLTPDPLPAAPR